MAYPFRARPLHSRRQRMRRLEVLGARQVKFPVPLVRHDRRPLRGVPHAELVQQRAQAVVVAVPVRAPVVLDGAPLYGWGKNFKNCSMGSGGPG